MSRMKTTLEIEAPEVLKPKGDGTVAREVKNAGPLVCGECRGSGYHWVDDVHTTTTRKAVCEVCEGSGLLEATVVVEWRAWRCSQARLQRTESNNQ